MKKYIVIIVIILSAFTAKSQQVFKFGDDVGRVVNVSFANGSLFLNQGQVTEVFAPFNNNAYHWMSSVGSSVVFSNDMMSFTYMSVNLFTTFKMLTDPKSVVYNSNTVPQNRSNVKTSRTKAEIDLQISKIQRYLNDAQTNYRNCSSVTLKPSYLQIIRKYEGLLDDLRRERVYAR